MTVQKRAERKGTNVFQEIYNAAVKKGQVPNKSQQSVEWIKKYVRKNVYRVNPMINAKQSAIKSKPIIGRMYLFQYEAITQNLPYWDAYPLVIFFNEDADHYWGFNFHYAPLKYRTVILNTLHQLLGDKELSEKDRIRQSYSFMKRVANFKFLAPCIKCYLKEQVQSRFLEIPATEWTTAMFLPVARWQNASQQRVHADYRKRV